MIMAWRVDQMLASFVIVWNAIYDSVYSESASTVVRRVVNLTMLL